MALSLSFSSENGSAQFYVWFVQLQLPSLLAFLANLPHIVVNDAIIILGFLLCILCNLIKVRYQETLFELVEANQYFDSLALSY